MLLQIYKVAKLYSIHEPTGAVDNRPRFITLSSADSPCFIMNCFNAVYQNVAIHFANQCSLSPVINFRFPYLKRGGDDSGQ